MVGSSERLLLLGGEIGWTHRLNYDAVPCACQVAGLLRFPQLKMDTMRN
jgi:hypothetical protein